MISESDGRFMRQALSLARRGIGNVEPNPPVGCVIVAPSRDESKTNDASDPGYVVIGRGYHRRFGGPHAEIDAIADSRANDDANGRSRLAGATAYVSLEPCCHHGKTPPCTDAIIAAGIARVVVATEDPFDRVAGGGIAALRAAGIEVDVGVCRREAETLLAPFRRRVVDGRAFVIAKWAMTIDGRIATRTGQSQWITGARARDDVHRTRATLDAIVTGMGTVRADDPQLTARVDIEHLRNRPPAVRWVMCQNSLPAIDSRLVATLDRAPLVLCVAGRLRDAAMSWRDRVAEQRGFADRVSIVAVDHANDASPDAIDRTMVEGLVDHVSNAGMTRVLIEGGGRLMASFFRRDAIDACHVYIGGSVFGGTTSPGPVGGSGVDAIADAARFRCVQTETFDDDVKLTYHRR